ncbi:predicted protein [Postia placenta Mad-698-R]|uniref:Uncharacterized protein n=1 Tax=Postia placenta MAD-698-R-SB12 TaxID=670580 RepID=A0A1X6NEG3_9APHY|nr:hypothetical protein POSPLADRAFT_1128125 [Postia placenta MAD-698-R-SB12]EED80484.1 predicted protein [Postia placenta Mad-698-R]OSX66892.1 hypothetical protein POSPLADRAFT_1128125 [Postia placenta MAD-698-R-SB12]
MSFQSFRLQTQPLPSSPAAGPSSLALALHAPPPPPVDPGAPSPASAPPNLAKKGPYGSGDADDGYTLVFASMAAFQAWRAREEAAKMVEFVKGDTHGSKAVPPRFKDHTKLVCARHSRNGRKKYVKKFPERVRKVPSRKLEGIGCPASISYKTYFDTDEVRAMYIDEHSHEIGPANFPFTKRGRKAAAEQHARAKAARRQDGADGTGSAGGAASSSPQAASSPGAIPPASASSPADGIAGPSSVSAHPHQNPHQHPHPHPQQNGQPTLVHAPPAALSLPGQAFQAAIRMIAPLPPPPGLPVDLSQDRWDRMDVLFQSIRENARSFAYPAPSVAALESVLIRLYLESPVAGMGPPPPHAMGGPDMNMDGMPDVGNQGHMGT